MTNRAKRLKLKICGMRDAANILEIAALQPNYMGFIFAPGSQRCVGENFRLPAGFPSYITPIGVFVNAPAAEVIAQTSAAGIKTAQLHGSETPAFCAELKAASLNVIKAFNVDDVFDFTITDAYTRVVDYFLFDTKGKYAGGNGAAFDWMLLKKYNQHTPFFISGGIGLEEIKKIDQLAGMNIHAIDVNSKMEVAAALKDPGKILALKKILEESTFA